MSCGLLQAFEKEWGICEPEVNRLECKIFPGFRKGKYTISANRYAEVLMEYDNNQMFPPAVFLLNYKFIGDDTLKITYSIDGRRCEEVWHRARKAPQVLIDLFYEYQRLVQYYD